MGRGRRASASLPARSGRVLSQKSARGKVRRRAALVNIVTLVGIALGKPDLVLAEGDYRRQQRYIEAVESPFQQRVRIHNPRAIVKGRIRRRPLNGNLPYLTFR